MKSLGQDFSFAIRTLFAKPAFSFVAIVALALGIGANTAIFSVVDAVLLRPLPYNDPSQLVWVRENNITSNVSDEPVSYPDFADWRDQSESFQGMAAFVAWFPVLTNAGEPERIPGGLVSPGFFQLLGEQAARGRTFLSGEDLAGKNGVVVLSYGLWRRRFASDVAILGKTITLNENPYQVIGIMPASFQYPSPGEPKTAELWTPLPSTLRSADRRSDFLSVIGRLKPGTSLEQASSEMSIIAARLENQYPGTNAGWGVWIVPLYEKFTGDVRVAMLILAIAVGLLLLIACANVANLLLVKATTRYREVAIRRALGALRLRLIQQFLTESCVLALVGGAAGVLLALLGIQAMIAFSPPGIPRLDKAVIDMPVLAFTLVVSLVTGVVFGLAPALQASGTNFNDELKEGGRRSTESVAARRIRGALLISEVALVLSLLIGSALMIKSFSRLQRVNPGFEPQTLLTFELALPKQKYKESYQVESFMKEVIQKVGSLPEIEEVAEVGSLPLSGNLEVLDFGIEGRPLLPPGQVNEAESQVVSPSYFHTMSIPLLRGRLFSDADTRDSTPVMIINDAMARRYFPDEDAMGKRLTLEDPTLGRWITIVGIVGNVRQSALNVQPPAQMYAVYDQSPRWATAVIVKSRSDSAKIVGPVRDRVASIDPAQPLYNLRTMADVISDSLSREKFIAGLISILTAVAFLLTIVGIYGVGSYIVTQRFNEIGIRMAMGAQRSQILKMVVWQGLKLALIGIIFGLGAALALTRLMADLLYGISPTDPGTFVTIPLLVAGVIVLASCVPALKATGIDPVAALRCE